MKITDIRTTFLRCDVKEFFDSVHTIRARGCLLVEVHTDAGLVGIGEAAAGNPDITRAIILRDLAPMLVGQDPFNIERLWTTMWARMGARGRKGYVLMAMSGLDVALWDLLGKATGMPVYRLLGGFADVIPAYASGGFYAVDKRVPELVEEARRFLAAGFTMMKMRVGRQPSSIWSNNGVARTTIREDIERVAAVREVLGPERRLMVAANCVYDPPTAITVGRELQSLDIYFFEEPVSVDDISGSAAVAAALDMRIAGYETEMNRYGFRDLIVNRAVDVVQPDVTVAGGFTECRRIAMMAEASNLACTPHAFGGALALVANAHLIGSLPLGGPLEFCRVPNPLLTDLLVEPPAIDAEGCYHLPQGPGLGAELNPETVARYRVD